MNYNIENNRVPIRNMSTTDRTLSILGGMALVFSGARRKSGFRAFPILLASEMFRRGVSGHCYAYQVLGIRTEPTEPWRSVSIPYELGVHVKSAVTIDQPREQIFAFWRELQNLPRVMQHLVSVEPTDGKVSHWVAEGPAGTRVEWDAEIVNEVEGKLIGWRSLPGSQIQSAGSVQFKDAPRGRGTEILIELQYNPPAGIAGAYVAKLFGRDPAMEIETDLYRLKQYLEAGDIATTQGQPQGDRHPSRSSSRREDVALAEVGQ